jgi:aldose 1-epimerase
MMLSLKYGASSIVVAPEYGAGLIGWMHGRTALLRRGLPQAAIGGNPHTMACFPLLPYANRIGHRRFTWNGVTHQLRGNFGDDCHSIHGIGWQRPWSVLQVSGHEATLALAHPGDADWPFAFDAVLQYRLDQALTVTISLTNRHAGTAPAGIGLHPFFPKAGEPSLCFKASGAWRNGDDALPRTHGGLPPEWMHVQPRPVSQSRLDNCFTDWDGQAAWRAGSVSLQIDACSTFRCLQVFTPVWADFFCAEPVSHMPDAINRRDAPSGQGMCCLTPGETLRGTIRMSPSVS